jgi:hypothetical protein
MGNFLCVPLGEMGWSFNLGQGFYIFGSFQTQAISKHIKFIKSQIISEP